MLSYWSKCTGGCRRRQQSESAMRWRSFDHTSMRSRCRPQNVDAMVKVAEAVNIPLATGERLYTKWGFVELLEKQVVALIQPDVCHAGGISELKKIAAMAEAYYVGFQPHNPYGPINTMAAIQVDVCTTNFMIQEGGHAPWFDQVVIGEFPRQKDGI